MPRSAVRRQIRPSTSPEQEKAPMKSVSSQRKATTRSCTKNVLGSNKPNGMKKTKPRSKVKVDLSCIEIQAMKTSSDDSKPLQGREEARQKINLQLFPMDEVTKKGLEQDNHNPYLELTLSSRKKISSVVKHLNIKWGSSKPVIGELMLFPYETSLNNLVSSRRWTLENSNVSAADLHASLGSPRNFRLRYGWSSNLEHILGCVPASNTFGDEKQPEMNIKDIIDEDKLQIPALSSEKTPTCIDKYFSDVFEKPIGNKDEAATEDLSFLWSDDISNISFGALMSELSQTNSGVCDLFPAQKNSMVQQFPNTCDSFDAAIAAFVAQQGPISQTVQPPLSSIWEAEETCHAFPFAKTSLLSQESGTLLGDNSLHQNAEDGNINPVAHTVCPQQELAPIYETSRQFSLNSEFQIRNDCSENITNVQTQCQDSLNDELKAALAIQSEPSDCDGIAPKSAEISSTPESYLAPCSRELSGGGGSGDILMLTGLIESSMDAFQNFSIF